MDRLQGAVPLAEPSGPSDNGTTGIKYVFAPGETIDRILITTDNMH
jgi:hypothetical protein